MNYELKKQFEVTSYDNCIEIRTNHPLINRIGENEKFGPVSGFKFNLKYYELTNT